MPEKVLNIIIDALMSAYEKGELDGIELHKALIALSSHKSK